MSPAVFYLRRLMDSDETLFWIGLKNLDHSELEGFVNILLC